MRTATNMVLPQFGRSYPDRTTMDAKYRFRALPFAEGAATPLDYVCTFDAASGDETGVGGGLTGADLVCSQVNGVGASSGGFRPIAKNTNQAFKPTIPFMNAFIRSAAGFSAMYRLQGLDIGANNYLAYMRATQLFWGLELLSANRRSFSLATSCYNAADGVGTTLANSDAVSTSPAGTGLTVLISHDYATRTSFAATAFGLAQPMKLADCAYFALVQGNAAFSAADAITAWSAGFDAIVGCAYGGVYSVGMQIGSVTFAKYPCFVPVQ